MKDVIETICMQRFDAYEITVELVSLILFCAFMAGLVIGSVIVGLKK